MTNKTAWTPGPWVAHDMHDVVTRVGGVKIAEATCRYSTLNEAQYNAQLIALAPEMAEALRAIEGLMECETYDPQDVQAMMSRVSAHVDSILSRLPVAK